MKKFIISVFFMINLFLFINSANSLENKILFKVNNEIITSLDVLNELRYLEIINEQFKNTEKRQAFEIAKKSLIREKIKEIELKKVLKEIKLENQFLNNILINYFKNIKINSISEFKEYFSSIGINPNIIEKKLSIEVLWNQLIFNKYNQRVKIDKQDIINNLNKKKKQRQFFLSEILFDISENEKLSDKFKQIKDKIDKSSFDEAALIYSNSDTANKGGELGWINETSVSNKIKSSLQEIDVGNYTNPIVIPGGFLILNIENIRETESSLNQDEEMKKIIREKTNEQLNQFSNIYFNKVRKNITINEL